MPGPKVLRSKESATLLNGRRSGKGTFFPRACDGIALEQSSSAAIVTMIGVFIELRLSVLSNFVWMEHVYAEESVCYPAGLCLYDAPVRTIDR